ncbi:hypothetical protein PBAL39_12593 [Pedobacter sp. BAL39]|uniref:carboxypeptidase-like regulatory domain-containing protein n=1 Tax=Pedobacter sp. BAL39 TaxID=391596 RepID=UPI000155A3A4|nr:carboxypeptidase-like regulatory domain-containing protein [Pedobacter sp. BAL39]EDM34305.1 hypothetical protein PBAL39_12593 [Pedobacter sp. BAL39]
MKSRYALLLSLVSIFLGIAAFTPKDDDPIETLLTTLSKWTQDHPQEKVYLHMDKPYYLLGDTIWFKGYVTTGGTHQLSALSGALYVDLMTERDSLIQSLKLPVVSGTTIGEFKIDENLTEGNYRIRAYTRLMRNADAEYFFDKTFVVGSPFSGEPQVSVDYLQEVVNGAPVLNAVLKYRDSKGGALANKEVQVRLMKAGISQWNKKEMTDANGNLRVVIPDKQLKDLDGSYLRSAIELADKKITTKDFPVKYAGNSYDLQFFPEGGSLLNGALSRIAFKAVGVDGLGAALTGVVTDQEGTEVATFESLRAGMGSFVIKPEQGKIYKANVTFKDGGTKTIALPKPVDEGYGLGVYQVNKDSILVRVYASTNVLEQSKTSPQQVSLVVHTEGETIFAAPVKISRAMTSIWLLKDKFPTGIAQFTLFSANNEPINERISFMKGHNDLKLTLGSDKRSYARREKVSMSLDAKNEDGKPVAGSFSVSVYNEDLFPIDENKETTILSSLLLSADLKGYVEQPNYYFANKGTEVEQALDNLMMTQGYRRFIWKDLLTGKQPARPLFETEDLGTYISGKVVTLGNKPVPNGSVTMVVIKTGEIKKVNTDAQGHFKFDGILLQDSVKFALQANNEKGGKNVMLLMDTVAKTTIIRNKNMADMNTNIGGNLTAYFEKTKVQDEALGEVGKRYRTQRLNEVVIQARKKGETIASQGMFTIPDVSADQSLRFSAANTCPTLRACLQMQMRGVVFKRGETISGYPFTVRGTKMAVFVDGRRVETEEDVADLLDAGTLAPEDVVKVNVVTSNQAMITFLGGPALLFITKRGYERKREVRPNLATISPKGLNNAREFYKPKYDLPAQQSAIPDMRTTVYWNPSVLTGKDGEGKFHFFNGDGVGNYRVVVEGIDGDGNLARAVYHYTVAGGQTLPLTKSEETQTITAPLDSLQDRMPAEKAYLHTDKDFYNIGDTLWFKSYLFDAASLAASNKSGLLYVELTDDSAEVVRRISIPIKSGLGWSQLPLPANVFHEGGYTLRAYTNWMQNFEEQRFFKKRLYLSMPARDVWLVTSTTTLDKEEKALEVNLRFNRTDQTAVADKELELRLYEGPLFLYKEKMTTNSNGELKFTGRLMEKYDGKNMKIEVREMNSNRVLKVVHVPLSIRRQGKIDLQFLPEGGQLVAGIKSLVGLKALGEDGKSIDVEGQVYDSKLNPVATFKSAHKGMGAFELFPLQGEVYTAKLSLANNALSTVYKLPAVQGAGTVLKVSNPEEDSAVEVSVLGTMATQAVSGTYYLIATSAGKVVFSSVVEPGKEVISISKKFFPTGIARLTLLKDKVPVNERIFFVDHQDRLQVTVSGERDKYHQRDSVLLLVEVKDKDGVPVKGGFSMAVTDNSQVEADTAGNYSVAASLLLNAELKGFVEQPGYYLSRNIAGSWQALDHLMLTQGWTGYSWKDVFSKPKDPKFKAEKEPVIRGRVTNAWNKPVKGAQMVISSKKSSMIHHLMTDSLGRYTLGNISQADSNSFFIQAKNPKGKTMNFGAVTVEKFEPADVPDSILWQAMPFYVNGNTKQLKYLENKAIVEGSSVDPLVSGIALQEVNISEKKVIPKSINPNGPGNADLIFDRNDIVASETINLYDLLKQKLPGFRVRNGGLWYNNHIAKLIIDGQMLINRGYFDSALLGVEGASDEVIRDLLKGFNNSDFRGLEVAYSAKYMRSMETYRFFRDPLKTEGPDGDLIVDNLKRERFPNYRDIYIMITTASGAGARINTRPDYATYKMVTIMHPKQFYSPNYQVQSVNDKQPDLRATLLWVPNIYTDANGKAQISFYTSDVPGRYNINVQGADMKGAIGGGNNSIIVGNE